MEWLVIGAAAGILVGVAVLFILKGKKKSYTLDEVIGSEGTVVDRIDNYAGSGLVKIGRGVWAARSVDDDLVYEPGDKITVVAAEGVRLVCR